MSMGLDLKAAAEAQAVNPKTLMGRTKLPMFSVVSPIALMHMAHAMRYGAFEALKKDGTRGYGPFNWRDIAIEYSTYLDAAVRHIAAFADGEDLSDADSRVHHLGHAMATLGILLDAIEVGSALDDRPKVGRGTTTRVMDRLKKIHAVGIDEPKPLTASDVMALAATIPAPAPTLDDVYALLKKVPLPAGVNEYAICPVLPHPCFPQDCDPDCPGPIKAGGTISDDTDLMCPPSCRNWPGKCKPADENCRGGAH